MTREELIERVEKVERDNLFDFKPFTQQVFHCTISSIYDSEDGEEKAILNFVLVDLMAVHEIMRHDIVDYDAITKVCHYVKQRLKTIEYERE